MKCSVIIFILAMGLMRIYILLIITNLSDISRNRWGDKVEWLKFYLLCLIAPWKTEFLEFLCLSVHIDNTST